MTHISIPFPSSPIWGNDRCVFLKEKAARPPRGMFKLYRSSDTSRRSPQAFSKTPTVGSLHRGRGRARLGARGRRREVLHRPAREARIHLYIYMRSAARCLERKTGPKKHRGAPKVRLLRRAGDRLEEHLGRGRPASRVGSRPLLNFRAFLRAFQPGRAAPDVRATGRDLECRVDF